MTTTLAYLLTAIEHTQRRLLRRASAAASSQTTSPWRLRPGRCWNRRSAELSRKDFSRHLPVGRSPSAQVNAHSQERQWSAV
jgi:hypothetical protein